MTVYDVYNVYKRLAGDRSDVYTTQFPASIMTLGAIGSNGSVLKSSVKHEWDAVNAAHVVNVCKAFKKRLEKMDETR